MCDCSNQRLPLQRSRKGADDTLCTSLHAETNMSTSQRRMVQLAAVSMHRLQRGGDVTRTCARWTSTSARPPTAIVMLNMGGPSSLTGAYDGVEAFLRRLFMDREIIRLGPLQNILGNWIARRRSPRIAEQYARIGGKSPIGDWTNLQGAGITARLNASPLAATHGPFKHYVAFRYAPPLASDALEAMRADGVTRAIAFSQYPQWSCTTTGSSLNNLWRETIRLGMDRSVAWSVIDRWYSHPKFIAAVARTIAAGLARFSPEERSRVVLLFSAHSVPMMVVNRGDVYVNEIAATVDRVMARVRSAQGGEDAPIAPRNPHVLAWQSKVGFLPWMGPSTASVIENLAKQGGTHVLVIPIAFTSDHIETLFEIDIEYAHLAAKHGITRFERAPALNGEEALQEAGADIVTHHLTDTSPSPAYALNCPGCTNPACRSIINPAPGGAADYCKLRDAAGAAAPVTGLVRRWPSEDDKRDLRAHVGPTQ